MSTTLLHLSPDAALVLLTCGVFFIYVELNRPGSILPGAVGLLAVLLAVATFARFHPSLLGIAPIFIACCIFFRGIRRDTPLILFAFATILWLSGFLELLRRTGAPHVHVFAAIPCALALGISTAYLTRIARRARRNKGLD